MPKVPHKLDHKFKKLPKMVVFDLDYTLWPFHVHELKPPFKKVGDRVEDAKGTLLNLYRDIPEIVKYLKDHNIKLALASRTVHIRNAYSLLHLLGLSDFFDYKEIFPAEKKIKHFANLKKDSKIKYKDMVFFDDEERNARSISKLGVIGIQKIVRRHSETMAEIPHKLDPSVKKFPKLAVFDLDHTLWPFHVYIDVIPPFKKIGDKVLDAGGAIIKYYRDVPAILKYLKQNNCLVAAASRTTEMLRAHQLVDLFNWNQHFDHKEIFPGQKTTHFANLKKATGIEYKDMVFFDDEERNSHDVSPLGVTCIHVKDGMSHSVLHKGLKQWASKN
ncbi:hypothetical protein M8J75_007489 [Diaphorina citri]|nr:hypothetical protein M8J75_007489 [Diaphorina citri]